MTKIKRYADFIINEKAGVPSVIIPIVDKITPIIMDALRDKFDTSGVSVDVKIVGGDLGDTQAEFPIGIISIAAAVKPVPLIRMDVSGTFDHKFFKIDNDLANFKIGLSIKLKEELMVAYSEEILNFTGLISQVKGTLSHELTHAYESYKRATNRKGRSRITTTKDFMYDSVATLIRQQNNIPSVVDDFLYLIYGAASYEVNARVTQVWSLIKNIDDPHDRMKAIEGTSMWKLADDLEKFDANDFYNSIMTIAQDSTGINDPHDQDNIRLIDSYISKIEANFKEGNEQYIKYVVDGLRLDPSAIDLLKKHASEYKKVAKMPAMTFLKFWEKKFNKAGRDLKRRLGRLTTHEN